MCRKEMYEVKHHVRYSIALHLVMSKYLVMVCQTAAAWLLQAI